MHRVPDKNPGSNSDTVCLKRYRVQTCHESDPIYIVSCSDTSCWLPEESRDRVGRSLELDPTRTSSHPDDNDAAESLDNVGFDDDPLITVENISEQLEANAAEEFVDGWGDEDLLNDDTDTD